MTKESLAHGEAQQRWLRHISAALAIILVAGCGCRDCCRCASRATASPPPELVRGRVTSELENSRDLASTMCGISAEGLTDVTVTLVEGGIDIPGGGKADVQGTAKPGKGDAGPVTTDPTKAVVCTGVVSYLLIRSLDESDENKAWRLDSVKLWEVKTPGVKWTRPSSHHHH